MALNLFLKSCLMGEHNCYLDRKINESRLGLKLGTKDNSSGLKKGGSPKYILSAYAAYLAYLF